jgi:5'-deoxynucleotidase YfbR-like HD superfamily hydrolase
VDRKEKAMSNFRRIVDIRTGGDTRRCHGIKHSDDYSVSRHTWGVLVLLDVLYPDKFSRLARYALYHDVPEAWMGDIPATTKNYSPDVKRVCDDLEKKIFDWLQLPADSELTGEDALALKSCDRLELYFWAKEQVWSGNLHAQCIIRQLDIFFEERPLEGPAFYLYLEMVNGNYEHRTDGIIQEMLK